ncbi:hypothetical protein T265_10801 [Opisthorchis viverrini]|uniref:Uncharacterized protein n=1 Tax=Opisthorchis viverrini TaxID=6198 RepID=A0A074ZBZ0_OPIVI|nr:hypothetical protein T265_10801 [Opisthorchis viverrini]KER20710.1 hypothetical protein T265_10801 [Opisthorchis viverrini]
MQQKRGIARQMGDRRPPVYSQPNSPVSKTTRAIVMDELDWLQLLKCERFGGERHGRESDFERCCGVIDIFMRSYRRSEIRQFPPIGLSYDPIVNLWNESVEHSHQTTGVNTMQNQRLTSARCVLMSPIITGTAIIQGLKWSGNTILLLTEKEKMIQETTLFTRECKKSARFSSSAVEISAEPETGRYGVKSMGKRSPVGGQ